MCACRRRTGSRPRRPTCPGPSSPAGTRGASCPATSSSSPPVRGRHWMTWHVATADLLGLQGSRAAAPLSHSAWRVSSVCCCLSIAPPLPVLLLLPLSSSDIAVHVMLAGKGLSWMCPLAALDFEYYLPIFLDGIRCPEDPCQFMARQVGGGRGREGGRGAGQAAKEQHAPGAAAAAARRAGREPHVQLAVVCWC